MNENLTYDRQSGSVRNSEGDLVAHIKFNGQSGSHGRRWQVLNLHGEVLAQVRTYREGLNHLTAN